MTCPHEIWERDTASEADGLCPLCLKEQLDIKAAGETEALIALQNSLAAIALHVTDNERLESEIIRLKLWLRRIDNINDDPRCFNMEISKAIDDAWDGKPMTGKINVKLPGKENNG